MSDFIERRAAIEALEHMLAEPAYQHTGEDWYVGVSCAESELYYLPSAQQEWNNHTVACLLAELFNDNCACNYCGIDEWLPEKCELLDSCPNPVGVACWEQFLKHKAEKENQ